MRKAHPRSLAQAQIIADHHNTVLTQTDGHRRMDADETNMLALMLEDMRSRVYEDQYPELKARSMLPVTQEVDTGAETFAYEETDEVGKAKIITNYADDPPSVESESRKVTHAIVGLGDSYHYSLQDIRRAAFSGQPLTARKAMAARRIWERGFDEIAALGAPGEGIANGFLNKTVGTSPGEIRGTAMTTADWQEATRDAAAMLAQLNLGVREMITDSKELWTPNALLLNTANFLAVSHTRISTENSETVLEAFLRNNPWIESVEPWNLLSGIDAADEARGVLYRRSAEVVEVVEPQPFEVLPPQPKNFAFKVLCHGRTAGAAVYRPLGMRYLTGFPLDPSA